MINNRIHLIAFVRSIVGSAGGLAVIIFCILGLVHIAPNAMVSIAALIVGVTLLLQALMISIEYSNFSGYLFDAAVDQNELIGGISIELLAAAATIILGVTALMSSNTNTMVAIAILINGAAFVIDSSAITRLNSLKMTNLGMNPVTQRIVEEKISTAMAMPVLIGIAAIVLGVLSLVGYASLNLNLIALFSLASCSLLMGSAITGRMISILQIIKTAKLHTEEALDIQADSHDILASPSQGVE